MSVPVASSNVLAATALRIGAALTWVLALLLAGCAGAPKYTVDYGRKVDDGLLAAIRAYGDGERALRPAILRSAALRDKDCDKQWELPFSLASSRAWSETERVGWMRALGVDERLTVLAVAPGSPLVLGERIVSVDAVLRPDDPEQLLGLMGARRDRGLAFTLGTSDGRQAVVTPFEVCRGYARFAPPSTPRVQDYHWVMSLHPLELAGAGLTEDEALWVVLWTQGLSEEGGLRMKAYHYGTSLVSTIYTLATLASGLKAAAVAAEAAVRAAQTAAAKIATDVLRNELLDQARAFAIDRLREGLVDAAGKLSRQQMLGAMQRAAANRGALSGVARVAATVFERADAWALSRTTQLLGNPLAAFTLHQKLIESDLVRNAFAFDVERMTALNDIAKARGLGEDVVAVLQGLRPDTLEVGPGAMPLASAPADFAYETMADLSTDPFARGLIDAMLRMPTQTSGRH